MSIILKGIDMPRKGTNIVLTLYGRDGTYDARTYPSGPRIKGEAIQIPKGHGDIKDINTIEDELDERCGQLSAEIVRHAPTILEAEE